VEVVFARLVKLQNKIGSYPDERKKGIAQNAVGYGQTESQTQVMQDKDEYSRPDDPPPGVNNGKPFI
jgi:hypothetical protein